MRARRSTEERDPDVRVFGQTRGQMGKGMIKAAALARSFSFATPVNSERAIDMAAIRHSTLKAGSVTVFYREAGREGNPVLPCHLIAPDVPSFGFTMEKVTGTPLLN